MFLRRVLILLTMAAGVPAQTACAPDSGFAELNGLDGIPYALVVHDDGSGPALYAGGSFRIASGAFASNIARWNGQAWSPVGSGVTGVIWALAVHDDGSGPALYAGGSLTATGQVPVASIVRWDGTSWTQVGGGLPNPGPTGCGIPPNPQCPPTAEVQALVVHDDGSGPALYAGGVFLSAAGAVNLARWDGQNWLPVGGVPNAPVAALGSLGGPGGGQLVAGGSFTSIGGTAANRIASWNGTAWAPLGAGSIAPVSDIEVFGSPPAIYALGSFTTLFGGTSMLARWIGSGWTNVGPGGSSAVATIGVAPDATGPALWASGTGMVVGGYVLSGLARWNGATWTFPQPVFLNLPAGTIWSIGAMDLGAGPAVATGGSFQAIGGRSATRIATFDGTAWSPLGGGLPATPTAFEVFDSGTGAALHVAVDAGVAADRLLRRNGTVWTRVAPAGINGSIFALQVHDVGGGPALFAGGSFSMPGAGIARFDGASWTPLGSGLVGGWGAAAFAVLDEDTGPTLIAGGRFTTAGGVPAANVARWNGSGWSALGTGLSGWPIPSAEGVRDLAIFDPGTGPELFACGHFNAPGPGVARWSGSTWAPAGGGLAGTVNALEVHDDGSGPALYAAGLGLLGNNQGNIARWSGAAWSPVGTTSSEVRDLAVFDDGGGPAIFAHFDGWIRKWNGAAWLTYGPQPDGAPAVIETETLQGTRMLLVGGSFTSIGSTVSARIARYRCPGPAVGVAQPGGAGFPILIGNSGLVAGHEYFNIVSLEPCAAGTGFGPYLGLCAADPSFLLAQILMPLGTVPFHFQAAAPAMSFGPYPVPPLTADLVCFDFSGGVPGRISNVIRITVN